MIVGAQACVLVFSTTDRESYEAIGSWKEKVEAEVGDIPTVLVQNKIDLLDETVIKKYAAYSLISHNAKRALGQSELCDWVKICPL